jgi:hypothetical protein
MKMTIAQHVRLYLRGAEYANELFRRLTADVVRSGADAVLTQLPPAVLHEYHEYLSVVQKQIESAGPDELVFLESNVRKEKNDRLCQLTRTAIPLVRAWFEERG